LSAVSWRNEAKSFGFIEKLYCTFLHFELNEKLIIRKSTFFL
jgi:hypothetical protein